MTNGSFSIATCRPNRWPTSHRQHSTPCQPKFPPWPHDPRPPRLHQIFHHVDERDPMPSRFPTSQSNVLCFSEGAKRYVRWACSTMVTFCPPVLAGPPRLPSFE